MISTVCWVPKGSAKAVPNVIEPTEAEIEEYKEQADLNNDDDDECSDSESMSDSGSDEGKAISKARAAAAAISGARQDATMNTEALQAALAELDMDNYDDEDDNCAGLVLGGLGDVARDDPYMTAGADESDSEIEDYTIRPDDLLILATKTEDDVHTLEVYVYEEASTVSEANLYVHHDIMLPDYPLCLAWLDCDVQGNGEKANLVAVGTMETGIEIWDLDIVDALEPVACLGGVESPKEDAAIAEESTSQEKKKKKKKKKKSEPLLREGSHKGAVMGLSWNAQYRNVLASCSSDETVKVWDLSCCKCESTLSHHSNKVQAVQWNPVEASVLLTGAYDKRAYVVDVRAPERPAKWIVFADVEALTWQKHDPTKFLVSSEDGLVVCFDARKGAGSNPLFRLSAHTKPTCSLSLCPSVPGLLATASTDKKVKLWDIGNDTPSLIVSMDKFGGAVFSAAFCGDTPYLLAVGGKSEGVAVWDIRSHQAVSSRYPSAMTWQPKSVET